jgi:tRNA-dihydrouridine synthase B
MIASQLAGRRTGAPRVADQGDIVKRHYEAILSHYGLAAGVRIARKHLGWYVAGLVEQGHLCPQGATFWRRRLVHTDDPNHVRTAIAVLYDDAACGIRRAA